MAGLIVSKFLLLAKSNNYFFVYNDNLAFYDSN